PALPIAPSVAEDRLLIFGDRFGLKLYRSYVLRLWVRCWNNCSIQEPSMARLSSLSRLSAAELQRELERRSRSVRKLERQRDRLAAKLEDLEEKIRLMGGSLNGHAGRGRRAGGTGRTRPKNDMTLIEALTKVLTVKTMRVVD